MGTRIDVPLVLARDIVHDVGTFAGRATTQHGQAHKVIQVLYIKIYTFHCAQPRSLC